MKRKVHVPPPEDASHRREDNSHRREWLLGIAAIVFAAAFAYLEYVKPDTPEEFLQKCREDHRAPVKMERGPETVHGDCTWPPVQGAQPDGYAEATVRWARNPDVQIADDTHEVYVIRTDCGRLQVQFSSGRGGPTVHEPIKVYARQFVNSRGEPVSLPQNLPEWVYDDLRYTPSGGLISGMVVTA